MIITWNKKEVKFIIRFYSSHFIDNFYIYTHTHAHTHLHTLTPTHNTNIIEVTYSDIITLTFFMIFVKIVLYFFFNKKWWRFNIFFFFLLLLLLIVFTLQKINFLHYTVPCILFFNQVKSSIISEITFRFSYISVTSSRIFIYRWLNIFLRIRISRIFFSLRESIFESFNSFK